MVITASSSSFTSSTPFQFDAMTSPSMTSPSMTSSFFKAIHYLFTEYKFHIFFHTSTVTTLLSFFFFFLSSHVRTHVTKWVFHLIVALMDRVPNQQDLAPYLKKMMGYLNDIQKGHYTSSFGIFRLFQNGIFCFFDFTTEKKMEESQKKSK